MTPDSLARLRRKLPRQPGITAWPVCSACGRQVAPRAFGREHCKRCEQERAEASVYFQAMLDATLYHQTTLPDEPMFGGPEAEKPFLAEDE